MNEAKAIILSAETFHAKPQVAYVRVELEQVTSKEKVSQS